MINTPLRKIYALQMTVDTARWIKFNSVGVAGFLIQISSLYFLESWLRIHYLPATVVAVEVAVIHNFLWHEKWTWRDRNFESRLFRFIKFQIINGIISLAGNSIFMWILAGHMSLPVIVANLLSVTFCSLINFFASDRIVFR